MHADAPPRRVQRFPPLIGGLLVVVTLSAWLGVGPAWAADPRLASATSTSTSAAVQAKLDELLQRIAAVEAEVSAAEAALRSLARAESEQERAVNAARSALSERLVSAYKHGEFDPTLALLSSESPREAAEQARMMSMLAKHSRADLEAASSARTRIRATAVQVARMAQALHARKAELDALREQVTAELAKAQQVDATIVAERTARGHPSRSGSGRAGAPAPVSGSIACPVGAPRSYRDTYGAPRSGGRSHKGVDILAPYGTPIYAYENGTITRMTSNSLGGISLYLSGDSGNLYYYTHLRGYVSGVRPGTRVSAGQHLAFNGDTGNARGIPHLHFEVRPGSGGNVNPYPYAHRACG